MDCWVWFPLDTDELDELDEVDPLEAELDDVEPVEVEVEVEPVDVEPVVAELDALGVALAAAPLVEPPEPEDVVAEDVVPDDVVPELVVPEEEDEAVSVWLTPKPNSANVPPSDSATAAAATRARPIRLRVGSRLLMQEGSRAALSTP